MKSLGTALLSITLFLAGCVTTRPITEPAPIPDGTYFHQVDFWMERTGDQRFRGVMKVKDGQLSLVLLSAFETTLARIQDTIARDEPRIELHVPELKEHEDRIRQAYLGLKPALVDLKVAEIDLFGRTADVKRENFGPNGVPRIIRITEDHFRFVIEVSEP